MVFWLLAALIVFASLAPIRLRPRTGHAVAERFIAFFALSGALTLAYPRRSGLVFCVIALTAVGLEAAQTLAAGRHPRVLDAVEKVAGAAAGVVVAGAAVAILERPRRDGAAAGAFDQSDG